MIDLLWLLIR